MRGSMKNVVESQLEEYSSDSEESADMKWNCVKRGALRLGPTEVRVKWSIL